MHLLKVRGNSMKVYAVRKLRGQWAVCCDENVLLQFETYAEAVEIARSAADVLATRKPSADADQEKKPAVTRAAACGAR